MPNSSMDSSFSIKKYLLKGGAFESSAKVITLLAGFGAQMLLARLLGPEQLGVYFLFLNIVSVCVLIAKTGIDTATLRLVAEAKGKGEWNTIKGLTRTCVIAVFASGSIVSFFLWFFSDQIGENWFGSSMLAGAISVGCTVVLLQGLQYVIGESFRGLQAFGLASYFQGVISSVIFLLVLLLLWANSITASLDIVIIFNVLSFFISAAISIVILMRMLSNYSATINREGVRTLFSIALPISVSSGAAFLLTQSDIFILGIFVTNAEVGYYGAASRLSNMIALILLIMKAILPPIIVDLYYKKNIAKLEHVLRYTATLGFIVCAPLSLILVVWSNEILSFVYGTKFTGASSVLSILAFGKLIHTSTGSSGLLLQMTGYHKTLMYITTFVALFGTASYLIVVNSYGKEGVAWVAAITIMLQNVLQLFYTKKLIGCKG
ncbi:MAG: oligosaccharide flippase family protein [Nitrospirae bacterium]|nr:oligosaccharide flippase family protein [Nitrospirota bacterium]